MDEDNKKPIQDDGDLTTVSAPSDDSIANSEVDDDLIKIMDGKFICSECENEDYPETNSPEGIIKADLDLIKNDLKEFPSKIIYGICPVCGMEYTFKLIGDELCLKPSDMEK